jgi:hypothetical protein
MRKNHPYHVEATRHAWRVFPFVLLALFAVSCGGPATETQSTTENGQWRTFEGTLNATGHRQSLRIGPERTTAIFSMTGSILLMGEKRMGQGFQCRMIGFNDEEKGLEGWSAWTDTRGDQVFSEIKGNPIGENRRIQGTILGGTGRYAGITGEYQFTWQLVVGDTTTPESDFQGRAGDIKGRFRRAGKEAPPAPKRAVIHEGERNRP